MTSQGGPAIFHLCLTLLSSHCPHTFFLYSTSVRGFSPYLAKLEPAAMPTHFLTYQYGWFLSLEEIALEDWTPVSSSSTFWNSAFLCSEHLPTSAHDILGTLFYSFFEGSSHFQQGIVSCIIVLCLYHTFKWELGSWSQCLRREMFNSKYEVML